MLIYCTHTRSVKGCAIIGRFNDDDAKYSLVAACLGDELAKRRRQPGRAEYLNAQVDRGEHHQYSEPEQIVLELAYHLELCPCAAPTAPINWGWLDLGAFADR